MPKPFAAFAPTLILGEASEGNEEAKAKTDNHEEEEVRQNQQLELEEAKTVEVPIEVQDSPEEKPRLVRRRRMHVNRRKESCRRK